MDEQKIIFSNRFEKEKFEDYKTDLGTDSSVTPDFTEADDFLKFIQKNRRSVPLLTRINLSKPFTNYPIALKLTLT